MTSKHDEVYTIQRIIISILDKTAVHYGPIEESKIMDLISIAYQVPKKYHWIKFSHDSPETPTY